MASSVEMPSQSSTVVPAGTRCLGLSPSSSRILRRMDWVGTAANGRNAPAGLRHPPHRTGRAPFKASGSPSDGLDLCVGNIGFSAIVVGFIHPSSGVVRFVPHPSDCPPSPCGRLSRPRTTTRALPHIRHWPKAGLLRRRRAGRGSQVRPGCVCVSRVPGSGVRGRGSGERETTASSLAGKEENSRKEDNSGQGKDGPAGAIAQGGNGR